MIDNELPPELHALLAHGRARLGPDAATIARLRSRIDAAIASGAPASAKAALGTNAKLALVGGLIALAGAGVELARRVADVPVTVPPVAIAPALLALEMDLDPAVSMVAHEPAVPWESPRPVIAASMASEKPISTRTHPRDEARARASLGREIELVDRATLALRRGELPVALDTLRLYREETADAGQLAQDASALEVEALCRAGDAAAAAGLAIFERRWPASAQRSHLITLCQKEQDRP